MTATSTPRQAAQAGSSRQAAELFVAGVVQNVDVAAAGTGQHRACLIDRVLFLCMIGGIAFLILTLVLIVIINNKRKAIMSKNSRVPLWT